MLAHCSSSSELVPGGNTGEIKGARKGTGHPNSHADGISVLSNRHSLRTKVYETAIILHISARQNDTCLKQEYLDYSNTDVSYLYLHPNILLV